MTTEPTTEVEARPTLDERHRMVVRLIAGGIGEGIDRLMTVSRKLDDADIDPASASTGPIHADPMTMALVGWMSELPQQIRNASRSTKTTLRPFLRLSGVVFDTGRVVAERIGVTSLIDDLTEPTRTAIAEEIQRLTDVGTAEYARGRVLAVEAFEQSVDGILGLVSDSEALDELVREQTIGITGSAVREMRETGAAADLLTERFFRRILGREPRALPPKPVARERDEV